MLNSKNIAFTLYDKKLFIRRPNIDLIKTPQLCGIRIYLKGRLKGVKRARKMQITKGMIQAQTFTFPIQAKLKHVQTKWGKFGLHVTLGQL